MIYNCRPFINIFFIHKPKARSIFLKCYTNLFKLVRIRVLNNFRKGLAVEPNDCSRDWVSHESSIAIWFVNLFFRNTSFHTHLKRHDPSTNQLLWNSQAVECLRTHLMNNESLNTFDWRCIGIFDLRCLCAVKFLHFSKNHSSIANKHMRFVPSIDIFVRLLRGVIKILIEKYPRTNE